MWRDFFFFFPCRGTFSLQTDLLAWGKYSKVVTLCFKLGLLSAQWYKNSCIRVFMQVTFEHQNRLPWEKFGVSSGSCCITAQLCGGWGRGWGVQRVSNAQSGTRQSSLIWVKSQSCCVFSQSSHVHDLNYWKHAGLHGYSESFKHEVSLQLFLRICPHIRPFAHPPLTSTNRHV